MHLFITLTSVLALTKAIPLPTTNSDSDLPWSSPCMPSGGSGISIPGLPALPTPPPLNLGQLLDNIKYRLMNSLNVCETMKQQIFQHRLDGSLQWALNKEHTHIEGLPYATDHTWNNGNDTVVVIKSDYKSISKLLVFLEQVISDDKAYYNSTAQTYLTQVQGKLFNILCSMSEALSCLNHEVDNHVSRDVMPIELREIQNIAMRNERDYIVAKDLVHFMYAAQRNYVSMTS